MANPFDQFHEDPPAVAGKPNPFDQFHDGKASAVADKPNVFADVGKAALTGAAKAAISVPSMVPDIAGTMKSVANNYLFDPLLNAVFGKPSKPEGEQGVDINKLFGSSSVQKAIEKATGAFPKPQTMPGKFTEAIFANVPAAALGGEGAIMKAANVIAPAVASEAAGEASAGTKFEPLMRFIGGLAGNVGAGIAAARASAPERMVREAVNGVTPAEFDAAVSLHRRAADIGVPISGPEAVQAATNNATRLGDVQRVVEGSAGGGAPMARFYSERPGQVDAMTGRALDTIAPPSAAPSTLGPQAAEAATNELDRVRQGINTATRPAYQAAETRVLAPADFDPIARDPAFQASLRRLRNDEVLGPVYANQPSNSIAVIDAVTKDMRDRGVALGNAAHPGFSSQTAGLYGSGAAEARDIARTPARGGVQAYDDALVAQEQARRQNLEPLEQGPLGAVASATTTRAASNAVLPQKPLTGGENELVDAIMRLETQAPGLPASLVRQNLADRYDTNVSRLVGGENQYGGARFVKDIAGTPQAETNLHAVVGALPTGAVAQPSMQDLVDVLRATGTRKPQGSATEFNRQLNSELAQPPISAEIAAAVKSGGLTIPTGVRDRARRAWLGRGTGQLSDMFLAPDSVDQIRAVAMRAAETPIADAVLRQIVQTPGSSRPLNQ
ncbi:MAG: hypothetical protein WBB98_17680 [Xanthobacteraceae bacterium]